VVLQLANIQSMPFWAYQADQALGQLFHRLVEGLAGAVAMLSQQVVLGFHDTGQSIP
jgi:hypothetical protein